MASTFLQIYGHFIKSLVTIKECLLKIVKIIVGKAQFLVLSSGRADSNSQVQESFAGSMLLSLVPFLMVTRSRMCDSHS